MASIIRDAALAPAGAKKIEWARSHMAVLGGIAETFVRNQPFKGLKVSLSIHLEAKTAYLAQVLHQGGAEVYATGSNPLSTQDDVCAALAESGVNVFATHGCTPEQYHDHLCRTLSVCPDVMIDDGGDMTQILHEEHPEWAVNLRGGCEETTTGILRLQQRAKAASRACSPSESACGANTLSLSNSARYCAGVSGRYTGSGPRSPSATAFSSAYWSTSASEQWSKCRCERISASISPTAHRRSRFGRSNYKRMGSYL